MLNPPLECGASPALSPGTPLVSRKMTVAMTPYQTLANGLRRLPIRVIVWSLFCVLTAWSPTSAQSSAGSAYRVRAGDILRIKIWRETEPEPIAADIPVEETGLAVLPVIGSVQVAGKSVEELRLALRESYSKPFTTPVVTITPIFPVSVLGAVVTPGAVEASPGMTLYDVISEAGGFLPNAKRDKVELLRGGQTQVLDTDTSEGILQISALQVQSGDRVHVDRKRGIGLQIITAALQAASFLATVYVAFK
jgi:protein involved in polysaccharide export with SLBB domain